MDSVERNKMIAAYTGLTEGQVGGNIAEAYCRLDGSWVVNFASAMDPQVFSKLQGLQGLQIPRQFVADWTEWFNGQC